MKNYKNKFGILLATTVAVLSTSAAFADDFGGFECQQAMQNVQSAQAGLNQAVMILGQVGSICGNNYACIITAQNAFNQATANLNAAQAQQALVCSVRRDSRDGRDGDRRDGRDGDRRDGRGGRGPRR